MKIRKYLEVLSSGLGGIKTNEDDHFIRDENVPFKSLRSDDDDDDDDDDDEFDDLDESDYDEHGLDKSGVFDERESRGKSEPKFGEGYSQEDFEADMESLTYLIRQLFKNTNMPDIDVDYDGLDIKLYVFLNKRERMRNLLKIFDVVYKLKKDILPQYHSEVELYQSKTKDPVLCFSFDYMEVGGNISTNKGDDKFNKAGITDRDADLPF